MPTADVANDTPDNPDPADQGTTGEQDKPVGEDFGDWLPDWAPDDAARQSER